MSPMEDRDSREDAADDRIDDRFVFGTHYVVAKGNGVLSEGDRFVVGRYPEWIRQLEPKKIFEVIVFGWDDEYDQPRNRCTYYTDRESLLAALDGVEVTMDMEHARCRVAALESELALVRSRYGMVSD